MATNIFINTSSTKAINTQYLRNVNWNEFFCSEKQERKKDFFYPIEAAVECIESNIFIIRD